MAGALSGGDKLLEALDAINTRLKSAGGEPAVKVGFLEGATYPKGTSVPMVAAVQEFGGGFIPPRPYFRNMIKRSGREWPAAMAKLLKAHEFDAAKVLGLMGMLIKGQLQQSILDTNDPPLAPSTIRRKGFSKPLIETSHMINSVDFEVST
jgi:hypothetical protein